VQEVVLAMLAKEPSHGYELRSRLRDALGPVGEAMNAGQIYVTLGRLEKAGLVASEREPGLPAPTEFHLKLVAAAAARLADPLGIIDAQRRELLRLLRDTQRAALDEPEDSTAGLLLEGVTLRLQADLRWLEACEQHWAGHKGTS
jgi:DNA-binding PadR family transcriptional regulator